PHRPPRVLRLSRHHRHHRRTGARARRDCFTQAQRIRRRIEGGTGRLRKGTRMKIVIAEKTSPAAIALFREEASWTVVTADDIKNDLPEHLRDADALVVRSAVQVDPAL